MPIPCLYHAYTVHIPCIYHAFTCLHHAQVVAQKLQHLLALLLKAEWPVGWPTFVPDLLGAAQVPA